MQAKIEEILDQAISKLKQGTSKEEVLSIWPEHQNELRQLLDIFTPLVALPKKETPQPAMQRKYIALQGKRLWFAWLHFSKLASVSMGVLLVVTAFAGTGYAASQAMPGQMLFGLKKTAEQVRVSLASDPVDKATLQVAIAKRRLNEAQQVISDPSHSPQQETAALTELSAAANNTVDVVSSAAKTKPTVQSSNQMLASLEDLTQQQQALLNEIKPADIKTNSSEVIKVAQDSATKVAEVKRYLEIATNEQILADLKANSETVTATGTLSLVSKDKLTINKTDIYLSDKTAIKDANGKALSFDALKAEDKVSVLSTKDQDKLIAQEITLLAQDKTEAVQSEVKGENTETAASSTTRTITASTSTSSASKLDNEETLPQEPQTDPNAVTGSFILEDPQPQSGIPQTQQP